MNTLVLALHNIPLSLWTVEKSQTVNVTSLANYNPVTLPAFKSTAELLAATNIAGNTAVSSWAFSIWRRFPNADQLTNY